MGKQADPRNSRKHAPNIKLQPLASRRKMHASRALAMTRARTNVVEREMTAACSELTGSRLRFRASGHFSARFSQKMRGSSWKTRARSSACRVIDGAASDIDTK
jgi:hypothetical protein